MEHFVLCTHISCIIYVTCFFTMCDGILSVIEVRQKFWRLEGLFDHNLPIKVVIVILEYFDGLLTVYGLKFVIFGGLCPYIQGSSPSSLHFYHPYLVPQISCSKEDSSTALWPFLLSFIASLHL